MEFKVFDLGLISFAEARQKQEEIFLRVKNKQIPSALLFCRHYPVITLGRQADANDILATRRQLSAKGVQVLRTERGGAVTYHGPGQLTVYPIFDLHFLKKDLHWFLRKIEGVLIDCLACFGVEAVRRKGRTGVWVGQDKIASIGIAVRNWITFHGFSLNLDKDDTKGFRMIRPCGMDIAMTSLEALVGKKIGSGAVMRRLEKEIAKWPM